MLIAVTSCNEEGPVNNEGKVPLSAPVPVVEIIDGTSFTLRWDAVENASGYTCKLYDDLQVVTDTSIRYEDLPSGPVVVEIKSNAPRHSKKWADSEYVQLTVNVEGDVISVKADNIEWNSVQITCEQKTGITYLYDIMSKEFYNEFSSDEQMISEYVKAVSAVYELRSLLVMGESSREFTRLVGDTEYIAFAVGMDKEGNMTTELFKTEFITATMPAPDPEMQKWFGTWTATFPKTLKFDWNDGSMKSEVLEEPMTFDITIEGDPLDRDQALVYGWSQCKDYEAIAALDIYSDNLNLFSGVAVDDKDERGCVPTWGAWVHVQNDDSYTLIKQQIPAYSISMDSEDTASSTLFEGVMSNGSPFQVVSLEIFAVADGGYTIYPIDDTKILKMPAGAVTLIRKK